jgi:hypothetical protein
MARNFSKLPWKKTFRSLPQNIDARLQEIPSGTPCIVCCTKWIKESELATGAYSHLILNHTSDIPAEFASFIPSPNVGPISYKNATLVKIPNKIGGKVPQMFRGRAPTRGRIGATHRTKQTRQVWPKTILPPSMSHLAYKRIDTPAGPGVAVHFRILEVICSSNRKEILRCINLLQENVGLYDLKTIDVAEAEGIRSLSEDLGWDVLSTDVAEDALPILIRRLGGKKSQGARRVQDRLTFIRSLSPSRVLHSSRGLVGYIIVEFCDKLTAFENLEIDHAMFLAPAPAEQFSRLTRSELKEKLEAGDLERFVHNKGWEERLRLKVKQARGDQSPNPDDMI